MQSLFCNYSIKLFFIVVAKPYTLAYIGLDYYSLWTWGLFFFEWSVAGAADSDKSTKKALNTEPPCDAASEVRGQNFHFVNKAHGRRHLSIPTSLPFGCI